MPRFSTHLFGEGVVDTSVSTLRGNYHQHVRDSAKCGASLLNTLMNRNIKCWQGLYLLTILFISIFR